MKTAIWIVFAALLALWTGAAWVGAEGTRWALQAVASGEAGEIARSAAGWQWPAWLSLWVDTQALKQLQDFIVWAVDALRGALPAIGSATGFVVALVWLTWGVGAFVLLLLAGGAHLLVGRLPRAGA